MESRTPDLRIANATLYQLSYDPTEVWGLPTTPVRSGQVQRLMAPVRGV